MAKITHCMSQCLRRDPRRRFAYGFTIEDTQMRLWFCDRKQIVVSTAFNFVSVSGRSSYRTHPCLTVV